MLWRAQSFVTPKCAVTPKRYYPSQSQRDVKRFTHARAPAPLPVNNQLTKMWLNGFQIGSALIAGRVFQRARGLHGRCPRHLPQLWTRGRACMIRVRDVGGLTRRPGLTARRFFD